MANTDQAQTNWLCMVFQRRTFEKKKFFKEVHLENYRVKM